MKIYEIKNDLQEVEYLLNKMENEIENLRYLVYRYYLEYGEKIKNGENELFDNYSFQIDGEKEKYICKMIDYKYLGIKSNYQVIKEKLAILK